MPTSPNKKPSRPRPDAAWTPSLLTLGLGLGAGALGLAWAIWGTGSSQPGPADLQAAAHLASPSSGASAPSVFAASGGSSDSQASPNSSPAGTASIGTGPARSSVAQPQPSSPEIDLATRAHLALQSGTAEEAHTVATYLSMCSDYEGVVALAYKLPLKNNPAHQVALDEALKQQRQCQALDETAKALYEPLLLKAFEGGSHNAARSMSTKPHLLAKFSPEQKARVVQAVKTDAAQGDVGSIHSLSDASARLGTSLQDDYAYALAFKALRLDPDRDSRYFGIFPNEYIAVWDEELKLKEQQLSKAELEQARQQAEAVLRSYRDARLKKKKHSPQQP